MPLTNGILSAFQFDITDLPSAFIHEDLGNQQFVDVAPLDFKKRLRSSSDHQNIATPQAPGQRGDEKFGIDMIAGVSADVDNRNYNERPVCGARIC